MCVSIIIQYKYNITTSSLLLSTSHNVYTCHSPKYHYIIVTVVYLVYCCITAVFYKKLKNVSCEYNRLIGWNSTLQAAWYIIHVRILWFLWSKPTIWLLILSFTQNIVRASSVFYPYEGYRSVTSLDTARVNRTIFHNHSVHWYYITLIKGRDYIKHDINKTW